jgi:hypothetical protein
VPPPAHMDTTPSAFPRQRSSWTIVTTIRAPVAAIGRPRLAPLHVGELASIFRAAGAADRALSSQRC